MVTYSEISPSDFPSMYNQGMSIKEIASKVDRSYTYVRNNLVASQIRLRTKGDGKREYIRNHPEWSRQFVKYSPGKVEEVSEEKILLLAMIITEGYADQWSVGFTNTQTILQGEFRTLVESVYGSVHTGTNGITTRLSSIDISKDIRSSMRGKTFSDLMLAEILGSVELTKKVLRIVADTEGSMIISVRKAPNNYTVECRVVLASKNRQFSEQIADMLSKVGIDSHTTTIGVQVTAKEQIRKFIELIGFTPGVNVVRKKAGLSSWYGKEKAKLSRLCLDIYRRQRIARSSGRRDCFEECESRSDTMSFLRNWYDSIPEVIV